MILDKQIQILVYKVSSDGSFYVLGEINQYSSIIWPDRFNGFAEFEMWAPITEENKELIKEGNILWCGGDNAAVIEIIQSDVNDDGDKTYNVKGRTLEMFLTNRIIWGTYSSGSKQASTVMYEIVNQNCVNPTVARRKIPFLELAEDLQFGGELTIQRTGTEVYETIKSIATAADIGFDVLFRPREKKMIFRVNQGVDRTGADDPDDVVEFSTELEDILTSQYYSNSQDAKNVALVMGAGEGDARERVTSGDDSLGLFERKELLVDARDLQRQTTDSEGTSTTLTDEQYTSALLTRGEEKLADRRNIESFEARIRVFGDVQYVFDVDYKKGDKVIVRDQELNVVVSARIVSVEETFDQEYNLSLEFGYQYPSIMQKITRITM